MFSEPAVVGVAREVGVGEPEDVVGAAARDVGAQRVEVCRVGHQVDAHLDIGMRAVECLERLPVGLGDRRVPDPHPHHDFVAVGLAGVVQENGDRGQQHHDESQRTGGQRGNAGPVTPHLTPERTIEETMCRWEAMNSRASGTIAIVVAAITNVHCELKRDCSSAVATVSTRHL